MFIDDEIFWAHMLTNCNITKKINSQLLNKKMKTFLENSSSLTRYYYNTNIEGICCESEKDENFKKLCDKLDYESVEGYIINKLKGLKIEEFD